MECMCARLRVSCAGFPAVPEEVDLTREVRKVAEDIVALTRAPVGDVYNGPVLFDGVAAAQFLPNC